VLTVPDAPIAAPPRSRLRVALGAAVVLVLVGLGAAVLAAMLSPQAPPVQTVDIVDAGGGQAGEGSVPLVVHVLGAVAAPGLYELPVGSRVVDAIAAAGGFAVDADRGGVNLARLLVDAEQVHVPVVGGAPADAWSGASGLVNLNTADAAALQTLPRVGPALADRIIAWRDANGGFRSIDDLLSVSGIGDKTFEGLQPLVTV
jgi:competence protein ComEA